MNEVAKIQLADFKQQFEFLSQYVATTQQHVSEFGKTWGEWGERIPRAVESLERASGFLDDARCELEMIEQTEARV
jgi:hypothetical protein